MSSNYMEDCIHLHACRRMQSIVKAKYYGMQIARKCDDNCTAYQDISDFAEDNSLYSRSQVQHAIDCAAEDGMRGYGVGDNLVEDYL